LLKYLSRVAIALSVLFNVILGGESNQTFSARNWSRKRSGKINLVYIIDLLFWKEDAHCLTAWTYWVIRKNLDE
jgi:hypothetical protein